MSQNTEGPLHLLGSETGLSFVMKWLRGDIRLGSLESDKGCAQDECMQDSQEEFVCLYVRVLGQNQVTANKTLINHNIVN